VAELVEAAGTLAERPRRSLLGITGPPGSGKSTVAEAIAAALDSVSVLVSMDGFHLANDELARLGRSERKGAPDTFDAGGFVHLLSRLRAQDEAVVYAPRFDRALEESIGSAVPVPAAVPLIIVEGNYLLLDAPDWVHVAGLLDECWYLDPGEEIRLARLVARHQRYGRSMTEAAERSYGSDQRNAELIEGTRDRATRVIEVVD
jgi:pantothenate kinase